MKSIFFSKQFFCNKKIVSISKKLNMSFFKLFDIFLYLLVQDYDKKDTENW